MNVKPVVLLILIIFINFTLEAQEKQIKWPGDAIAAVCLTYDDAMETHLDIAIPDLNEYGFKGTFFLEGDNIGTDRLGEWREASRLGHELGNHTAFHPCSENLDFITPEFAAENYTVERFLKELEVMNTLLYAIDGKKSRTYAYTCGQTEFGGVSIIDTLRQSGLFTGARGSGGGIVDDVNSLDLFHVNSGGYQGDAGDDLIGYVKKAGDAGGIAVITFHGVGGQYISVSHESHRQLLEFLSANSDLYWVAPFGEVLEFLITQKKQPGME